MKPTAWLLNIGRGPVIDEGALVRALSEKRVVAGPGVPETIAPAFNENLRRYLAGRPLRFLVRRPLGY